MRQIKFRAWDGKRMIEPYSVRNGKAYIIRECDKNDKVLTDEKGTNYYCNWDVDVATDYPLMQFTGLHDANGVEIYEGDIINVYNWGLRKELLGVAIVEWCTDDKGWRHNPALGADDAYDQFRRVEIIGNIHENPELLEAQE